MPFEFSDEERGRIYADYVQGTGRSRADNMAAFWSTFDAWRDYKRTGEQTVYVGYSPIIGVDSDKILNDLPNAHVLHVVRNPWSSYADTKKRPMPLSQDHYMLGWTMNQYYALYFRQKFPQRMHIVRVEDVMADPITTLGTICEALGLEVSDSLKSPSWNGKDWRKCTPGAHCAKSHQHKTRRPLRNYLARSTMRSVTIPGSTSMYLTTGESSLDEASDTYWWHWICWSKSRSAPGS